MSFSLAERTEIDAVCQLREKRRVLGNTSFGSPARIHLKAPD